MPTTAVVPVVDRITASRTWSIIVNNTRAIQECRLNGAAVVVVVVDATVDPSHYITIGAAQSAKMTRQASAIPT